MKAYIMSIIVATFTKLEVNQKQALATNYDIHVPVL